MNPRDAAARLHELADRGRQTRPVPLSPEWTGWIGDVQHALVDAAGEDSFYVHQLWSIKLPAKMLAKWNREEWQEGNDKALGSVIAILDSAGDYFARQAEQAPEAGPDNFDPGLWGRVRDSVGRGAWDKVPAEAAIYVESTLRAWGGRPRDEVGVSLMTALFKPGTGSLVLGDTTPEQEGWHALARGFAGALSNVDRHHLQERPDAERYAYGVLATASLLLTQVRFQHGEMLAGR